MTYHTTNDPVGYGRLFGTFLQDLLRKRRYRKTVQRLRSVHGLSDHTLRDIGFEPDSIPGSNTLMHVQTERHLLLMPRI